MLEAEISIIIPIFNEKKHIDNCVNSIIESTDNIEETELLLIDGGSTDGTLEKLKDFEKQYSFIRVIHNEKRKTAPALNIGINNSKGKYIVRLDAHGEFSKNYIKKLVSTLDEMPQEVVNVGGVLETKPGSNTIIARSIAIALSSQAGVGNSDFRTKTINKPQYVPTVAWGAYRREALEEVGLFDESVPSSEDLELSQKLITNGKKIMMIPGVTAVLFSRSTLSRLSRQMFDNGRCVTKENKSSISFYKLRHYVPLMFTSYILSLLLIIVFLFPLVPLILKLIILLPLAIYTILIASQGLVSSIKQKNPLFFFSVPLAIFVTHFFYGLGSIFGLLQMILPLLPTPSRR